MFDKTAIYIPTYNNRYSEMLNYANTLIKEEQQKQALAQLNLTKEDIEDAERIRKHCEGGK